MPTRKKTHIEYNRTARLNQCFSSLHHRQPNGDCGNAPSRMGYGIWYLCVQRFGYGCCLEILFNDRRHKRHVLPRSHWTKIPVGKHPANKSNPRRRTSVENSHAENQDLVGGVFASQLDSRVESHCWGCAFIWDGFCRELAIAILAWSLHCCIRIIRQS